MNGWLIGPNFPSYARNATSERSVNLMLQTLPGSAKAQKVLIGTPGLRSFGTLTDRPGRGLFAENGRVFAGAGTTVFEVFSNGTSTALGTVQASGSPMRFSSNGNRGFQLAIVSNGKLYVYNRSTGVFALVTDAQVPGSILDVGYIDGYFVVTTPDRFGISALLDGITWGADVGQRVGAAEDLIGSIIDHEVLWLYGSKATEVWWNSGNASFPFQPIDGAFLEHGLAATYAAAKIGDSVMWLSEDERGGRAVMRNQGYNAAVVSDPGVAALLTSLPSVQDAVMWAWSILDHVFAVLSIPSQKLTLLYDTAEGVWTRWAFWNGTTGEYEAHRAACHCYAWGKHLVLDRETGAIHELAMDVHTDAGEPKRWLRRSPQLAKEGKTLFHHSLELEADKGSADGAEVQMSYSDDGGETFGNELAANFGSLGQYEARARWFGLGSSRNRVYNFTGTGRIVLIDGYLDATEGLH